MSNNANIVVSPDMVCININHFKLEVQRGYLMSLSKRKRAHFWSVIDKAVTEEYPKYNDGLLK